MSVVPQAMADAVIGAAAEACKVRPEQIRKALPSLDRSNWSKAVTLSRLAIYRAISEALRVPLAQIPLELERGRSCAIFWQRHGDASVSDDYQRVLQHVKAAAIAAMGEAAA